MTALFTVQVSVISNISSCFLRLTKKLIFIPGSMTVTFAVQLPAISNYLQNRTPTVSPTTPTVKMQVTKKLNFFVFLYKRFFFSRFFVIPLCCCNDNPRMHGNSYQGKLKCLVLHQTLLSKKGRFVNVCFILFMKLVKRWYAYYK